MNPKTKFTFNDRSVDLNFAIIIQSISSTLYAKKASLVVPSHKFIPLPPIETSIERNCVKGQRKELVFILRSHT